MFNNMVIDGDDHVVKYVKSILFVKVRLEKDTERGKKDRSDPIKEQGFH